MSASVATGVPEEPEQDPSFKIIEAGYRVLFGREPDPTGIAVYREFLGEDPLSRLEDFLKILLVSPETDEKFRQGRTIVQALPGTRRIDGKPARRVVSLGSRCTVAQHLEDIGLREGSYPFDWIFTTPEIVVQCLEDDFEMFLRRDQYRVIPPEERKDRGLNLCDHVGFLEGFGQWAMFNHRDPTQPKDYAYLERCVDRFRAAIASPDPTLFVLVADSHKDPEPAFLRLSRVLHAACKGQCALMFIVVNNRASKGPLPWVRELRRDGEHELIAFDSVGNLGGTRFDRTVDEIALEALIRRYQFTRVEAPLPAGHEDAAG